MTPFDALRVQRFDNLYDPTPHAELSLTDALDAIIDGLYAADIRSLRTVFARRGEDAYRAAKQRLPQITFAGTFTGTRAKEHLKTHSEVCLRILTTWPTSGRRKPGSTRIRMCCTALPRPVVMA
jgi:hypothetical protein